jgi:thymidylate synthase
MNSVDKQYLDMLRYILDNGEIKSDRTGTGTISIFDYSMTFDMSEGFPLLTSKKVFTKAVIHELIWFLRGDTNIKYLVDNGVNIWNGDAYKHFQKEVKKSGWENFINLTKEDFINKIKTDNKFAEKWGELGPVYGKQWRNWSGTKSIPIGWEHGAPSLYRDENSGDQILDLVNSLKNNPDSRRLLVSAWNVSEIHEMVLPPCHFAFQCYTSVMSLDERKKRWCHSVEKDMSYSDDISEEFLDSKNFPKRKLSLKWMQRSIDGFLGLSFNITSYAILLHLLAKEVNMVPHLLKFNGGDCHIYLNHIEQCKLQLVQDTYELPKLVLKNNSIFDLKFEDIEIVNYKSSPVIKAPLSN